MAINIPIISSLNTKGFDAAKKEFASLQGFGAKSGFLLQKAMLPAAGAVTALAGGLGMAAKAAAADEKSANLLAQQLKRTLGANDEVTASMARFVDQTQLATNVTDDELRPALANLVRFTKDAQKAQDLLTLSVDTAIATGKDLTAVSTAIGRAYDGNFTSLKKLGIPLDDNIIKTKPYEHQLVALEKAWDKQEYAFFMEMGTGKSKVLIDNIAVLYDKGKINGVLIIAPKGVYKNWFSSEIPIHIPSHIQYNKVLWTALASKSKEEELNSLFKSEYNLHILIMNVEAFSTKKGLQFALKFLNSHNTLMAVDESTTIKTPSAKRTKSILALAEIAKYRRILTGSPVTKSPLDLYKQCEFLDEGLLDYTSYYAFKTRYAVLRTANFGGRSVQIVVGYRNLDELSEKIEKFSYRVLKEDCLDLPSYSFTKRIIQLSKEQKKIYESMKQLALAQLGGKLMTTATALVQLMRLHQITCGLPLRC